MLPLDDPTTQRVRRVAQRILLTSGLGVVHGEEAHTAEYHSLAIAGWQFATLDADIIDFFPAMEPDTYNSFAHVDERDVRKVFKFITAPSAALLSVLTCPAMDVDAAKSLMAQRQRVLEEVFRDMAMQMKQWNAVVMEGTDLGWKRYFGQAFLDMPTELVITKDMVDWCKTDEQLAAVLCHGKLALESVNSKGVY